MYFTSKILVLISMLKIVSAAHFPQKDSTSNPLCKKANHPYVASISVVGYRRKVHLCGGALLQSRWVITAAHCFGSQIRPYHCSVAAGAPNTFLQNREVSDIIIHENYDPKTTENDVSLLYLTRPFSSNEYIGYVKIPGPGFTRNSCVTARIIGWISNRVSVQQKDTFFHEIYCMDVLIFDQEKCKLLFSRIDSGMLCSGPGLEGGSPCSGDSGGPLICDNVLIGVISWGMNCSIPYGPSVFTHIEDKIDFVKSSLKKYQDQLLSEHFINYSIYFVRNGIVGTKPCYLTVVLTCSVVLFYVWFDLMQIKK